jgi:hypothetical protein
MEADLLSPTLQVDTFVNPVFREQGSCRSLSCSTTGSPAHTFWHTDEPESPQRGAIMTLNPLFPLSTTQLTPDTAQHTCKSDSNACNETRSLCSMVQTKAKQHASIVKGCDSSLQCTEPLHHVHASVGGEEGGATSMARVMLGVQAFLAIANNQMSTPCTPSTVACGPTSSLLSHTNKASEVGAVSARSKSEPLKCSSENAKPRSCNSSASSRLTWHEPHLSRSQSSFRPGIEHAIFQSDPFCISSRLAQPVASGQKCRPCSCLDCLGEGVDQQFVTDSASSGHLESLVGVHKTWKPLHARPGGLSGWIVENREAQGEVEFSAVSADSCKSEKVQDARVSKVTSAAPLAEPFSNKVTAQPHNVCLDRQFLGETDAKACTTRNNSHLNGGIQENRKSERRQRRNCVRAQVLPLGVALEGDYMHHGSDTCGGPRAHPVQADLWEDGPFQLRKGRPAKDLLAHKAPISVARIARCHGKLNGSFHIPHLQRRGAPVHLNNELTLHQAHRELRSNRLKDNSKFGTPSHAAGSAAAQGEEALSLCGGQISLQSTSSHRY